MSSSAALAQMFATLQNPAGRTGVSWGVRATRTTVVAETANHTAPLPVDRQPGDALIVIVATGRAVDLGVPTGFTQLLAVDRRLYVYFRECRGDEVDAPAMGAGLPCRALVATLSCYGLATRLPVPYAYTNSATIRTQHPMPTITGPYDAGMLLHVGLADGAGSWGNWPANALEHVDLGHTGQAMTLTVGDRLAPTGQPADLAETTFSTNARAFTASFSFAPTGVATYLLGNPYTFAADTGTTTVATNRTAASVFDKPPYHSWVYRVGWHGEREGTTASPLVGGIYAVTASTGKPGALVARTAAVSNTGTSVTTKFAVGETVRVTDSLNLRTQPSTTATSLGVMIAGTTATVLDGPRTASGYVWWQLNASVYSIGWAAENWLERTSSRGKTDLAALAIDSTGAPVSGVPVASTDRFALAVTTGTSARFTAARQASVTGNLNLFTGTTTNGVPVANLGNATVTASQGHLSLWAWAETNVPPEPPLLLTPAAGVYQRTLRPTFEASFQDRNGVYGSDTGMGVDRGDRMTKYQLRIRYQSPTFAPIVNPGFDVNFENWSGEARTAGLTTSVTRTTSVVSAGAGALSIQVSANTTATANTYVSLTYQTDLPVAAAAPYLITWTGRTTSVNLTPNVRVLWLDETDTAIAMSTAPAWTGITINSWTPKSFAVIAPAGAVRMRVQLYVNVISATATGTVYYDTIDVGKPLVFTSPEVTASAAERSSGLLSYTVPQDLADNQVYEWQARTADYFGEWSDWSAWQGFVVSRVGPVLAMYPNEASLFTRTYPGYYQGTTRPDFVYRWQSGQNISMFKYDFEIGTYADFRTSDPYRQVCTGATFPTLVRTTTLLQPITDTQTLLYLATTTGVTYDPALDRETGDRILVLQIGTEYLLVTALDTDNTPWPFTVRRGLFGTVPRAASAGATVRVYRFGLKRVWTADTPVDHVLGFNELFTGSATASQRPRFASLAPDRKYYWRMRGYDTANLASMWSTGIVNELDASLINTPAVYPVNTPDLARLRSTSHRFRLYFCAWDTWKCVTTYPKLTWIKGSDGRDPDQYTPARVATGDAPYELRFPGNQDTPSEEVNTAVQETAFAVLGDYGRDAYRCVVNIGPNRLAFAGEPIAFSAERSWTRGNVVGQGWTSNQFSWTFAGAVTPTATGVGPHQVRWTTPGLYTVTCRYDAQPAVTRQVRVYRDREDTAYDVVEVGAVSGTSDNGWSTTITVRTQLGNLGLGDLTGILEYQAVGVFCEEEWEVDGVWVRQPVSGYTPDPRCLVTGYVQNGSIRLDANSHTFTFAISPLADHLKAVTMYGTQTWSQEYYRNVALLATPELIPQGSTITFAPMHLIDVLLLFLQQWTNILERHDFIAWYDTSLQARDTVSTNEGSVWSSLQALAEAEYAWLYTDQGNGLRFEPNPSLRSWGAFGDLHPIPYVLDNRDLWQIDIQQKLMNQVNYCQITGTRPYFPNAVFEGKYPSAIPEGTLGQWLVKTGQLFSSQWFADYIAENMYWDANRKISATVALGMNRRIDIPGRIFIDLEIPEREIFFDAKEFYVTGGSYTVIPAEGKFSTQLQVIENMYRSSGITGVRKTLTADARIWGAIIDAEADALVTRADGITLATTTLVGALTETATTLTVASAVNLLVDTQLKIDSELLLITAIAGTTITVQRAFGGSVAAAHASGATVVCQVFYRNLIAQLKATGHVGSVQLSLLTAAQLILEYTPELTTTAVIAPPLPIVWTYDRPRDLTTRALIQQTVTRDLATRAVIKATKTVSMFTTGVIV